MATQNKKPTPKNDKEDYLTIGLVFTIVGVALLLTETARAAGLPFFILGLTFFVMSRQDTQKKRKK